MSTQAGWFDLAVMTFEQIWGSEIARLIRLGDEQAADGNPAYARKLYSEAEAKMDRLMEFRKLIRQSDGP
jgi:hypothetical protein